MGLVPRARGPPSDEPSAWGVVETALLPHEEEGIPYSVLGGGGVCRAVD